MTRGMFAALALTTAIAGLQSWRLEMVKRAWAEERAETAEVMADRQTSAAAKMASLRAELMDAKEVERDLPNGDACGLDAGRVRLLPSR